MSHAHDPEALHDAAAGWREMGRHLDDMVRHLDRQVGRVRGHHWQGPSADAFGADWDRLKSSVHGSLPAFEGAAVDLESAAETPVRIDTPPADGGGADDGASGAGAPDDGGPESSGTGTAYGFMALGQVASALGGTFGRCGGRKGRPTAGGGRLHADWSGPSAPLGPDPFGAPAATSGSGPRAGEAVARGRRTETTGRGPATSEERREGTNTGGTRRRGAADAGEGPVDADHPAPAAPGPDAAPADTARTPAGPDTRRHGAFG